MSRSCGRLLHAVSREQAQSGRRCATALIVCSPRLTVRRGSVGARHRAWIPCSPTALRCSISPTSRPALDAARDRGRRRAAAPRPAPARWAGRGRGRAARPRWPAPRSTATGTSWRRSAPARSPTPWCRARCGSAAALDGWRPLAAGAPAGAGPAARARRPGRRAGRGAGPPAAAGACRPARRAVCSGGRQRRRRPPLLRAAVVHGELLALRPFAGPNGVVARAAARLTLIAGGLDPRGLLAAGVGPSGARAGVRRRGRRLRHRHPRRGALLAAALRGRGDGRRGRSCGDLAMSCWPPPDVAAANGGQRARTAPRLRGAAFARPTGLPGVHLAYRCRRSSQGAAATCLPWLIARGFPVAVHGTRFPGPRFLLRLGLLDRHVRGKTGLPRSVRLPPSPCDPVAVPRLRLTSGRTDSCGDRVRRRRAAAGGAGRTRRWPIATPTPTEAAAATGTAGRSRSRRAERDRVAELQRPASRARSRPGAARGPG